MVLKVAKRGLVPPFIVMDVMQAAAEREASGAQVLHMEVGQPGTPAPKGVLDAARRALDADRVGYTVALGVPSLRQRIGEHYKEAYGLDLDPDRIAVTTGSSSGFLLAFLAAFDVGDRVALAAPGYPAYRNILQALGLEPVLLPTTAADRYQPSPAALEAVEGRLDGLIVASPSNPTGTMLARPQLKALVEACRTNGIRLISDEIYHGISYGDRAISILELCQDAIVINSFSKYYSMTGWRLGWMVLPEDLRRPVECLAQNFYISPPTLSQLAAEAAFDCGEELDGHVARYARNRTRLLEGLPRAGFTDLAPADGAFYLYADVSRLTNDSQAFCRRLLHDLGIAITPGVDFDPERGNRFVRFSFAGPEAVIEAAVHKLTAWRNNQEN